ncbi:MAG: HAMP domain-containing sensor histidine kinase [Candidatus Pedobacter colombiensis]|uniref:histidine kinase n=1 Tax=Candidatus Pedobacter colombiensis TaxID=3121371 RepID=A0AAJ5W880_9SPHI|nr:HAMP domain-containing sensor histidine kinase [Pedobacter sp.]WEK18297.1 MAG: HAMP domain-containing sensor histidine kinase [Pedobacter sp.]
MKVTYTRILARKTLLTFLVFIIILAVAALFVRNAITKKLEDISKLASNIEHRLKPEQALLLLHQAEDDFQESLLDINGPKSNDYKVKLTLAFNKIDTLLNAHTDTAQLTTAQGNRVRGWYNKKLELSNRLFGLKHNFDSLLTVYAQFNGQANNQLPKINTNFKTRKKRINSKTDTIRKAVQVEKKGLFGRLKDAISNKQGVSGGVIEINHNNSTNTAELRTQKIIARDRTNNAKKLQELQQHNVKMLNMQRELISLNTSISNELERIVNDLKDINYKMADELKGMAFKNYQETTSLLNKFYLAALFLVLLFAALLIIFIFQLNKSELQLLKENKRSVNIARQKMELLTHMTHEIRNPLTAIKGFLYIFTKTPLTQRQTDMLESIKGSSDMLLRTLNDTLDAAKMETSELKIESDPFNPYSTINQVIESMSYSATKKKLEVNYNFKEDKETQVLGDNFRLKQVMVNLLSNAIKYTKEGTITINAELLPEDTRLQVDIIDTGMGISPDQQANLFSQYYQTNSAKGQVGTGLGLYICKQLVEMQKGKISVKSAIGVGTTFSFFIPYQKA